MSSYYDDYVFPCKLDWTIDRIKLCQIWSNTFAQVCHLDSNSQQKPLSSQVELFITSVRFVISCCQGNRHLINQVEFIASKPILNGTRIGKKAQNTPNNSISSSVASNANKDSQTCTVQRSMVPSFKKKKHRCIEKKNELVSSTGSAHLIRSHETRTNQT